jgi:syntaxin 1B/2/3
MNDLLGAVHSGGSGIGRGREQANYDIEAGFSTQQSEQNKEMEQFFAKVEEIKADLADIKTRQREVQQMHERSKTIVRQKEMQKHREDMQVSLTNVLAMALHCCKAAGTRFFQTTPELPQL